MDQTYMKKQNILKLLLTMALPMVISMLVNSLYNIVDSFFVAKIRYSMEKYTFPCCTLCVRLYLSRLSIDYICLSDFI
jgi:hypothetical protein